MPGFGGNAGMAPGRNTSPSSPRFRGHTRASELNLKLMRGVNALGKRGPGLARVQQKKPRRPGGERGRSEGLECPTIVNGIILHSIGRESLVPGIIDARNVV